MKDKKEVGPIVKIASREIFIPKSIAQRCPVCNGFGSLKYGSLVCHGCDGKGYVLVPVEREEERLHG